VPHYRIRFHTSTGLTDEHVEAERLDHEAGGWLVFRATVLVIGAPREVVVRRVAAAPVRQVTQVVWTDRAAGGASGMTRKG
jgi:hypothetical protein